MLVGPPGRPEGPLEVMDIYADRCALMWDKPKEDGGSPITHYIVEKLDMEKGEWEKVCDTEDMEIDVSDLTPGHKYQFRVSAVNSEGISEPLATDGAVLAKDPWGKNSEIHMPRSLLSPSPSLSLRRTNLCTHTHTNMCTKSESAMGLWRRTLTCFFLPLCDRSYISTRQARGDRL